MKYKLINAKTNEETICDKVAIDGFDYYASDEKRMLNDFVHLDNTIKEIPDYNGNHIIQLLDETLLNCADALNCKKVIATNNPNIDLPQVVDKVERLAFESMIDYKPFEEIDGYKEYARYGFIQGYNKSQETHPFSEQDMIEFNEWQKALLGTKNDHWLIEKPDKELLQLWKQQQPKTLYYE